MMNRNPRLGIARRQRKGFVLVVVLVTTVFLSLAAYTYADLMLAEYSAADVHGRGLQAQALADSGLQSAIQFLAEPPETQLQYGGHYSNPGRFQGQLVLDGGDPAFRGRFSILAPQISIDGLLSSGLRFGLEDESARVNLNALLLADTAAENGARELLMALPGMNEEIADAILDWIDEDDEPREFGAESAEYSAMSPPYLPKNGPLESVEELLLVRGVTPYLLFGADANRNGMIDAHETFSSGGSEVDNSDGLMSRGWSAYFTLYSAEDNLTPEGEPKIDLNNSDLNALHDALAEALDSEWANFIVALRLNGPYSGNSPANTSAGSLELDLDGRPGYSFTTVLDLIGVNVEASVGGGENDESNTVVVKTPFPDDPVAMNVYLPVLMDYVAVNTTSPLPARVNINQASLPVLMGIPGMDEEIVEQIISEREPEPTEDMPSRRHETWLLSEGIVDLEQMKELLPFVCARGSVFRAQIVGYFEEGGPAARIEAIIASGGGTPRLLFWRDISHLGRGHAVETLGIQAGG